MRLPWGMVDPSGLCKDESDDNEAVINPDGSVTIGNTTYPDGPVM